MAGGAYKSSIPFHSQILPSLRSAGQSTYFPPIISQPPTTDLPQSTIAPKDVVVFGVGPNDPKPPSVFPTINFTEIASKFNPLLAYLPPMTLMNISKTVSNISFPLPSAYSKRIFDEGILPINPGTNLESFNSINSDEKDSSTTTVNSVDTTPENKPITTQSTPEVIIETSTLAAPEPIPVPSTQPTVAETPKTTEPTTSTTTTSTTTELTPSVETLSLAETVASTYEPSSNIVTVKPTTTEPSAVVTTITPSYSEAEASKPIKLPALNEIRTRKPFVKPELIKLGGSIDRSDSLETNQTKNNASSQEDQSEIEPVQTTSKSFKYSPSASKENKVADIDQSPDEKSTTTTSAPTTTTKARTFNPPAFHRLTTTASPSTEEETAAIEPAATSKKHYTRAPRPQPYYKTTPASLAPTTRLYTDAQPNSYPIPTTTDRPYYPTVAPVTYPSPTTYQPAYTTSAPYQAPVYTTSAPYQAPAYTTSPPYQAPAYTKSAPYQAPAYTTSPPYHAPAYTTSPPYQSPAYTTSPPYQAPVYSSSSYESRPQYTTPVTFFRSPQSYDNPVTQAPYYPSAPPSYPTTTPPTQYPSWTYPSTTATYPQRPAENQNTPYPYQQYQQPTLSQIGNQVKPLYLRPSENSVQQNPYQNPSTPAYPSWSSPATESPVKPETYQRPSPPPVLTSQFLTWPLPGSESVTTTTPRPNSYQTQQRPTPPPPPPNSYKSENNNIDRGDKVEVTTRRTYFTTRKSYKPTPKYEEATTSSPVYVQTTQIPYSSPVKPVYDKPINYNKPPPQLYGNTAGEGDYSAIPGEPGTDYPIYSELPATDFKCSDQKLPGFYADEAARCQIFHVCWENRQWSFLCPNGSIFSQGKIVAFLMNCVIF